MRVISSLGRGGQSALRFARLRMEKRHNYVRKVSSSSWKIKAAKDFLWYRILHFVKSILK